MFANYTTVEMSLSARVFFASFTQSTLIGYVIAMCIVSIITCIKYRE